MASPASNTPSPTSYHWIITVRSEGKSITVADDFEAAPGETRRSAFEAIYQQTLHNYGFTDGSVIFFSLEPNQL